MKTRSALGVTVKVAGAIAAAALVAWAGLQVQPAPFKDYPGQERTPRTVPLPTGLPAPVDRFYRGVYGERVPVVESVVITGRGVMRPFGAWMPMRFRFIHDAGRGYRHYIEACWFGMPVLAVNERYVDGRSLIEIPIVGTDSGPKIEQAANLGMWAELASAAPSVLLTDPRVRWRPVDAETALLDVPLGRHGRDTFVARFDPDSGMLTMLEAMRYRDSKSAERVLWLAGYERDGARTDLGLPATGTATWLDMGTPWASFTTESIRRDVNVRASLRTTGP